MSSPMRDTYVGISVHDNATRALTRIDNMISTIENHFQRFGSSIYGSFRGMNGLNSRIDLSADNMRTLQQYTSRLEQEMSEARSEMQRMADRIRVAEQETEDLRDEMRRVADETNRAEKSMGFFGSTAGKVVGLIGAAFAVDKIKDFSVSAIELAAGTQALNSQFDQVFVGIQDTASTSLNKIADDTGILPDRLKGSFTKIAAFAKTTGADTADALGIAERATLATADIAAWEDKSQEDIMENMQSFLKGNFENDAALGISATETTRNAKANELYGKSFTKLSEAQKQLTLLGMVEDGNKLSGALGQASRESDGFENQVGNLKSAWDGLKGTLATPMLNTITTGLGKLTKKIKGVDAEQLGIQFKNGFDKVMDVAVPTFKAIKTGLGWVIDNKDILIAATAGIAGGFAAFKTAKTAIDIFDKIKSFGGMAGMFTALTNPIGIAAVVIGGLVAAGVYLYQNWDTVKEKALGLWQTLKENPMTALVAGPIGGLIAAGVYLYNNWDTIKEKAISLWTTATEKFASIKQSVSDFVQPAIGWFETIGQKWDNFKSSLSNFKVPEWVSSIGSTISGAASKVKGWVTGGPDGSHATGLANVGWDGYRAELHKGEAVLTAKQSNALRSAGMLTENSDGTPSLNMGGGNGGTVQQAPAENGGGNQFIFQISGENASDIAQKVREVLSDILGEEMQIN